MPFDNPQRREAVEICDKAIELLENRPGRTKEEVVAKLREAALYTQE